jgi:hypothetical protein
MEIADAGRLMISLRASSLSLTLSLSPRACVCVCVRERETVSEGVRAYYLPTNICYFQYLRDSYIS